MSTGKELLKIASQEKYLEDVAILTISINIEKAVREQHSAMKELGAGLGIMYKQGLSEGIITKDPDIQVCAADFACATAKINVLFTALATILLNHGEQVNF